MDSTKYWNLIYKPNWKKEIDLWDIADPHTQLPLTSQRTLGATGHRVQAEADLCHLYCCLNMLFSPRISLPE